MSAYIPRIRLYVQESLLQGAQLLLSKPQSHYLATVMRQREGAAICVFNGRDGEWRGILREADSKRASIQLESQLRPQLAEPDVWLVFAPIKLGRIDFLVEKATELGAAALLPVQTARTIVSRVNDERLQAHIVEAAEQSERLTLPALHPLQSFRQLLAAWPAERTLIYADETHAGSSPAVLLPSLKGQKLAVLIDPEGGFSLTELEQLRAHPQAKAMSLGTRILRADTAALAALAGVMALTGEW